MQDYKWDDRYEWINIKKSKANSEYNSKEFDKALLDYLAALLAIKYDGDLQHTEQMHGKLRLDVLNNIVAALLEQEMYSPAIAVCNIVIALYPRKPKLLMRRGKSYLRLKQYDEAM